MKRHLLIWMLTAFAFSGCGVGLYFENDDPYLYGQYGFITYYEPVTYFYDEHYTDTIYFETPYLDSGCRIYLTLYGGGDAWVSYDDRSMFLYDVDYARSDTTYTFEVLYPGRQEFYVDTYARIDEIGAYYSCR